MQKYDKDASAYIVVSNQSIQEVKIVKYAGGMYTIRFIPDGGGMKVRESRLFPTSEEAEASLPEPQKKVSEKKVPQYTSPWDWNDKKLHS